MGNNYNSGSVDNGLEGMETTAERPIKRVLSKPR